MTPPNKAPMAITIAADQIMFENRKRIAAATFAHSEIICFKAFSLVREPWTSSASTASTMKLSPQPKKAAVDRGQKYRNQSPYAVDISHFRLADASLVPSMNAETCIIEDALQVLVGAHAQFVGERGENGFQIRIAATDPADEIDRGPGFAVLRRRADRQFRPLASNEVLVELGQFGGHHLVPPAPQHARADMLTEEAEVITNALPITRVVQTAMGKDTDEIGVLTDKFRCECYLVRRLARIGAPL
jgi:hypothetical protein